MSETTTADLPDHLAIDHGNAGDGLSGRFGTCSACGRRNKVVGPIEVAPEERRCIMPRGVARLPEEQRPASGCDAQRGPRPGKRRVS